MSVLSAQFCFLPNRCAKLDKMLGKYLIMTVFLCFTLFFGSVSGSDLSETQKSALEKLDADHKIIRDYIFQRDVRNEQNKIREYAAVRMRHGGILSERTHFEMEQIGASYLLIGEIMKASKDVVNCMKKKTEDFQRQNEDYHMKKFYSVIRENQHKAHGESVHMMVEYNDRRNDLHKEYNEALDKAKNKVKKTEDPNEIAEILKGMAAKGEEVKKEMDKCNAKIDNAHLNVLLFADERVNALRKYCRDTVDGLPGILQNCFLVNSPYYDIKNLFNKLM